MTIGWRLANQLFNDAVKFLAQQGLPPAAISAALSIESFFAMPAPAGREFDLAIMGAMKAAAMLNTRDKRCVAEALSISFYSNENTDGILRGFIAKCEFSDTGYLNFQINSTGMNHWIANILVVATELVTGAVRTIGKGEAAYRKMPDSRRKNTIDDCIDRLAALLKSAQEPRYDRELREELYPLIRDNRVAATIASTESDIYIPYIPTNKCLGEAAETQFVTQTLHRWQSPNSNALNLWQQGDCALFGSNGRRLVLLAGLLSENLNLCNTTDPKTIAVTDARILNHAYELSIEMFKFLDNNAFVSPDLATTELRLALMIGCSRLLSWAANHRYW